MHSLVTIGLLLAPYLAWGQPDDNNVRLPFLSIHIPTADTLPSERECDSEVKHVEYHAQLHEGLPARCVVLLEDIDAVAKNRANAGLSDEVSITMSGLLNIIDGIVSQEGRILSMTTNYTNHLDAALVRPSRVDVRVEFQLVDSNRAARLFNLVCETEGG
ncbi:hypothetical protein PWT90_10331 [Aphanocladium album]|nr:hypothetical protein PWT90_10331 [Aphanocladium album]